MSKIIEFKIHEKITYKQSLNKIYAGIHWASRKKITDYWHQLVEVELMKQKIKRQLIQEKVILVFYYKTRLDALNHSWVSKMVEDSLKGYLLKDDNKKYVLGAYQGFHNEGDFIKVQLVVPEGDKIEIKI